MKTIRTPDTNKMPWWDGCQGKCDCGTVVELEGEKDAKDVYEAACAPDGPQGVQVSCPHCDRVIRFYNTDNKLVDAPPNAGIKNPELLTTPSIRFDRMAHLLLRWYYGYHFAVEAHKVDDGDSDIKPFFMQAYRETDQLLGSMRDDGTLSDTQCSVAWKDSQTGGTTIPEKDIWGLFLVEPDGPELKLLSLHWDFLSGCKRQRETVVQGNAATRLRVVTVE